MSSFVGQIIRQHPREALFVQPLEWTSRHLELLQCCYEQATPSLDEPQEAKETVEKLPEQAEALDKLTQAAKGLATSDIKNHYIKFMLTEAEGPFKLHR